VSCGQLEQRCKPVSLSRGSWDIFDPRVARPPAARKRGGVTASELFSGELHRKLHYQSIFDQTDKHLPAGVAGRKTEHATSPKAAMMFDEISEKWLKIGSKRNRHADEAIVSYCFSFCSSLRFRSVPQR
jgi:hypothetical protein